MATKGLHKYTVSESKNLKISQNGFDKVAHNAGNGDLSGHFIAIYNPDDSAIQIKGISNIGDGFTNLSLCSNGTIYGNFYQVRCNTSGKSLIATRG